MAKVIFLPLFMLMLALQLHAQPYTFQLDQAPYEDLSNAAVLSGNQSWDDPEYVQYLGFTFSFFGVPIDSVGISDYVLLPVGWIDAIYSDFVSRGAGNSPISYLVEGTPGSRIAKIEWKNVGFFCELDSLGTTNDFTNVQVWLYESNSQIEIRVGPNSISNPFVSYCTETGPFTGLFNSFSSPEEFFYLTGDAGAPTVFTNFDVPLSGTPTDGTVYRFIPSTMAADHSLPSLNDQITVYPNPISSGKQLMIKTSIAVDKIELFDGYGKNYGAAREIETFNWNNYAIRQKNVLLRFYREIDLC